MTNIAGHEDEDSEGHEINRCFKPSTFGKVNEFRLHHFSDASEEGYGQVSYLINTDERIHCCFLGGKSKSDTKESCIDASSRTDCSSTVSKSGKFLEERLQN